MKSPLITSQFTASLANRLGVSPDSLVFEPISTGLYNASWFLSDGIRDYVLRVAPSDDTFGLFYERRMMRQEPGIHALLSRKTAIPVPAVHVFDDSRNSLSRDYLLMERLPGQALSETRGGDAESVVRAVGYCLHQAHSLTADTYGYRGEHRPMKPQTRWVDAFHIMWNRLIDDVVASGHYRDDEAARLRSLLDKYIRLFERPVAASLCHMDVWAQNILVDRGALSGLIDWDRALWGDPEIEFAVLDYCGISGPAFWEGYGVRRDNSREARVRTVFYFLYELQKYIPIRHFRGNSPATARSYKRQVMSIVQKAFG